jgi:hypothetical protein
MTDPTLRHFRTLAGGLSRREKVAIEITLKNNRTLQALYDPLFKTITLGGMTFPSTELNTWTKLCWESLPQSIIAPHGRHQTIKEKAS